MKNILPVGLERINDGGEKKNKYVRTQWQPETTRDGQEATMPQVKYP